MPKNGLLSTFLLQLLLCKQTLDKNILSGG